MKNYLRVIPFICILLLSFIPISESSPKLQILFVGNSFVFQNDMPDILEGMLGAAGVSAEIDIATIPGGSLKQHAKTRRTIKKIQSQNWDYVILQEQSVIPSIKRYREGQMFPAVRTLSQMHNGSTMLFMTWGRRQGMKSSGFNRYRDMQDALTKGYIEAARREHLSVAPVGEAFRVVLKQKPFYPLWSDDGSHPSYQGSYLSACVFFQMITQQSPVGNTYKGRINKNAQLFLQKAAKRVVSSKNWKRP
jgi:hypothetical protein